MELAERLSFVICWASPKWPNLSLYTCVCSVSRFDKKATGVDLEIYIVQIAGGTEVI